jgi:hypothetical protein
MTGNRLIRDMSGVPIPPTEEEVRFTGVRADLANPLSGVSRRGRPARPSPARRQPVRNPAVRPVGLAGEVESRPPCAVRRPSAAAGCRITDRPLLVSISVNTLDSLASTPIVAVTAFNSATRRKESSLQCAATIAATPVSAVAPPLAA